VGSSGTIHAQRHEARSCSGVASRSTKILSPFHKNCVPLAAAGREGSDHGKLIGGWFLIASRLLLLFSRQWWISTNHAHETEIPIQSSLSKQYSTKWYGTTAT
jgi:hypothetical protein